MFWDFLDSTPLRALLVSVKVSLLCRVCVLLVVSCSSFYTFLQYHGSYFDFDFDVELLRPVFSSGWFVNYMSPWITLRIVQTSIYICMYVIRNRMPISLLCTFVWGRLLIAVAITAVCVLRFRLFVFFLLPGVILPSRVNAVRLVTTACIVAMS